ncbi:MAG TPA: co-chaperone GroES family protein [Cytophagaceae bacterium]|jgi:co-chaperonin GroES (HSP10)
MYISLNKDIDKLVVIGDRVLIKPKSAKDQLKSGLFLPPGVHEKERIQSGYILKVGPGFPIPTSTDDQESWKSKEEKVKYLSLQVKEGDLAIYLQSGAHEITYNNQKYFIVSQSSILMVERDEDLVIE